MEMIIAKNDWNFLCRFSHKFQFRIAGDVEMVEEFIRDGTNVDANQENDDWPALIVAAKSGKWSLD